MQLEALCLLQSLGLSSPNLSSSHGLRYYTLHLSHRGGKSKFYALLWEITCFSRFEDGADLGVL
jgi:hypothetical protein